MGKKNLKINFIKTSSIYISTFAPWWEKQKHAATNGMIEPLLYYFSTRIQNIRLLEQPYPGSTRIIPFYYDFVKSKRKKSKFTYFSTIFIYPVLYLTNKSGTHIPFKIRDFFSTLEAGIRTNKKYDIFVGLESVNTLAGLVLKRLGKVETVCYYCSDYSPIRFKNKFINKVYLWLDRIAAEKSDYIWDVSLAMQPARIKSGLDINKSAPVVHVPNALFKEQIDSISFSNRQKYSLVFVGTLGLENGPDLAIMAMTIVIKKFPKATLHIIGGGGVGFEKEYLNKLIKKHKLENNVKFHGFISDVKQISSMIKHFEIALAPYKYIEGSIRLYGDATKIRQYTAAGLPIITTKVPPLGKEIEKNNAGIIVDDSKEAIAKAIIDLFTNKIMRETMTKNAISFAKHNIWENTYDNALKKMNKKLVR